jgi:two-component system, LuxR family, sensor histidine kinase DctS
MIKILHIEDNSGEARQVEYVLSDFGAHEIEWVRADRLAKAFQCLSHESFDLILCDLTLPDCMGLKTFYRVKAKAPDTPIVVFSGLDYEEIALEALREGAYAYLIKGRVSAEDLMRVIRSATNNSLEMAG